MRIIYITLYNTNALEYSRLPKILPIWFVLAKKFEAKVYVIRRNLYSIYKSMLSKKNIVHKGSLRNETHAERSHDG